MPAMTEADFMALREDGGHGVVPEEQRNRGFDKVGWEPGEGGIGDLLATRGGSGPAENGKIDAFLAGVAAGADPQEMAKELRGGAAPKAKAKRGPAKPAETA